MHKRRPRAPKSVVIPQWAGVPAFQEGAEAAGGGSASSWALRSGAIRGALRTLCSPASPQETSPGPIYFLDPKVTRFGRSCTPAYSMQGRGKSRGLEVTPGPGAYSPEKVAPVRQRTPPAFTLGSRLRPQPLDTSAPAPNTYTLPSLWGSQIFIKPSSPSYTVAGRTPATRRLLDPAEMPGPGQYESPDPNTYRQRRPAFTMLGRPRAPRPAEETPGPGTHSPEQVTVTKARAPAFTMGIRHSKRATTMAVDTTP
uniref:Outer dense fiber of sperm tails 3 like 2 n=1 Tax=Sus scrofa TaxID=9823 RepID=A0A8D1R905_PIG